MMDGYLARKLHAESKSGAVLDSVADICFVACCAIRARTYGRPYLNADG